VVYDVENLTNTQRAAEFHGEISRDWYGRLAPRAAHGSENLGRRTSSAKLIMNAACSIYDRIVDKELLVRRFYVNVVNLVSENSPDYSAAEQQLDMFTDYEEQKKQKQAEDAELDKEHAMQEALLKIRERFGKNAVVRGLNMQECATAMDRNKQIGGHKA
jgi:DNA polymerase V